MIKSYRDEEIQMEFEPFIQFKIKSMLPDFKSAPVDISTLLSFTSFYTVNSSSRGYTKLEFDELIRLVHHRDSDGLKQKYQEHERLVAELFSNKTEDEKREISSLISKNHESIRTEQNNKINPTFRHVDFIVSTNSWRAENILSVLRAYSHFFNLYKFETWSLSIRNIDSWMRIQITTSASLTALTGNYQTEVLKLKFSLSNFSEMFKKGMVKVEDERTIIYNKRFDVILNSDFSMVLRDLLLLEGEILHIEREYLDHHFDSYSDYSREDAFDDAFGDDPESAIGWM